MSFKALAWAADQMVSNANCKLVLLTLANFADDKGRCWPSQQTIAEKSQLSRKTVNRCFGQLRESGHIENDGRNIILQIESVTISPKTVTDSPTQEVTQCNPQSLDCNPVTQVCNPPLQPSEPVIETVNEPKDSKLEKPDDVSKTVWKDFLKLRKEKKSPVTQTAINRIRTEAEKARWTLERALTECCARGWQGFKAEWIEKEGKLNEKTSRKPSYAERLETAGKAGLAKALAQIGEQTERGEDPPPLRITHAEL